MADLLKFEREAFLAENEWRAYAKDGDIAIIIGPSAITEAFEEAASNFNPTVDNFDQPYPIVLERWDGAVFSANVRGSRKFCVEGAIDGCSDLATALHELKSP